MSYLFNLTESDSVLRCRLERPLELDEDGTYVIGCLNFTSYNMIPNVDSTNNVFQIGQYKIVLPVGTYEIVDIERYVKHELEKLTIGSTPSPSNQTKPGKKKLAIESTSTPSDQTKRQIGKAKLEKKIAIESTSTPSDQTKEQTDNTKFIPYVSIKANMNILKCEIKSILDVHMNVENSIGEILGFKSRTLQANIKHTSENPINITKIHTIYVNCNLVTNSFKNGVPVHVLYSFNLKVNPGYKIEESPINVIYLPINTRYITEIIVQITDQNGNLINFNEQLVTVGLHLKKLFNYGG